MTVRDADRDRVRKRALLLVGTLAGVLVLAGLLPWVTGADPTIRFLALPLLLAGLMVTGLAVRFAKVRRERPMTPVTPVERGCEGCVCGLSKDGCATTATTGAVGPADAGAPTARATDGATAAETADAS